MLKSLAVGAVSVLTLGVLALPRGEATADRPAAPESLAPLTGQPVLVDDGLVHVIVTPTGAPHDGYPVPDEVAQPATEPVESSVIGATDGASAWTIEGGEGQLVLVEGQLMRLDEHGELVPAGGQVDAALPTDASEASEEVPDATFGHPTIDLLAGRDGVDTIRPIGDGSFAVSVEDAAMLDDLPVETVEDVPLALLADPYESYQWALENTGTNLNGVSGAPAQTADADIDATDAWPFATGTGVVVAVIDSGVDFAHPDLARNRWSNPGETCGNGVDDDGNGYVDDCHGWDFGYEDNEPFNPGAHPHGTHVAGIVAAEAGNGVGVAGVAPDAQIMDLNVGRITPSGEPAISTSSLARAVRYAADNGADIINLSLGTPPGTPRAAMATLESAIVHAGSQGALVVVAAGNDSANLDGANTAWPASYDFPYVVTVAATAPNETLASFSNYGSVIDVAAPGHVILSTAPAANGTYLFMSGTSQATPVVAGVAALALDADPSLTASGLRDAIRASSDRHDAYVARVPDGLRANAGNLVSGAAPEVGFDEVAISVTGLAEANDLEPVAARLDIVVPTDEYDEPFSWNATLVAMTDDGDYVVVDHEVAVDGASRLTDVAGAVDLALAGTGTVELTTDLPQGRYALVLEPIAAADPTVRLGDAFVAAFDVADGAAPVTTTTTTPDGGSTPSPTTTVLSTPTTLPPVGSPSPSPSPSPTTTTPASSSPTTTVSPSPSPSPTTTFAPSPTTTSAPGQAPATPTTTVAPPTTEAPGSTPTTIPDTTTTAPPSAQPPTTAPPTTAPPTSTQPPVSAGEWSVSAVSPAEGSVDTMNLVRLNGTFPAATYVWFGQQPGVVLASSPYTIDVLTPLRATGGVVDIALVPPGSNAVLTVPNAYTFVGDPGVTDPGASDPDGSGPGADPNPGSPTTTAPPSSSNPGVPTTTASPANPGSPSPTTTVAAFPSPTTTAPSDPGSAPAPSPTTTVAPGPGVGPTTTLAPSPRQQRAVLGDQVDLGSGLRGRPITDGSPVSSAPLCTSDPCSLT